MESGAIADSQLSASSEWSDSYRPQEARLNNNGAWYPSSYTTSEWLQIDLIERMVMTGVQTQGDVWRGRSYYVRSFKFLYSDDGTDSNWNTFQENGSDKIFVGNRNANGVKTNDINPPIEARFIRLMAVDWNNRIAFRLELLGCELQPTTVSISTLPTTTSTRLVPTSKVETTAPTSTATSTLKKTAMPTTQSTPVNTYTTSSTTKIVVTTLPTSPVSALSEMPTPPSNNTSGNSDGLAGNKAGTTSGAIIGGVVAAGVIIIISIVISIFFIRRRRTKDTGNKNPSPQPDESGTVDNIYYGGVRFAANGNASTNGNVSIDQSGGMVDNDLYAYAGITNGDVMIDQSHGMVDNDLYAGTSNDNAAVDQSEGTVDNLLYAGTSDTCSHHGGDDSAQDNVYYNVAHTSDEGSVENDIYC